VGIGNMDDDSDLEIIGTYDDHQIQAFKVRACVECAFGRVMCVRACNVR
jgi:ferredoxin-like protein FixX